jgi:hypothetical protein
MTDSIVASTVELIANALYLAIEHEAAEIVRTVMEILGRRAHRAPCSGYAAQIGTCDRPVPASQAPYRPEIVRNLFPRGRFGLKRPGHRTAHLQGLRKSGRQDLNLRPPGPQPVGRSLDQLMRPVSLGVPAPECIPGVLSLFPKLFPQRTAAGFLLCTTRRPKAGRGR